MTEQERELDLQLAESLQWVSYLKQQAADNQKAWEHKYMLLRTEIAYLQDRLRRKDERTIIEP
jgi:phage-related minor tail protein